MFLALFLHDDKTNRLRYPEKTYGTGPEENLLRRENDGEVVLVIDIRLFKDSAERWKGDALVLLLREEDCEGAEALPCGELVKELAARKDFTGKKGSLLRVPLFGGAIRNLYLAGLGKAKDCRSALVRDMLAYALRTAGRQRNETALVPSAHLCGGSSGAFEENGLSCSAVLAEAVGLCGYAFDKYKKKEEDDKGFSLREVAVAELVEKDSAEGLKFAAAQIATRELANEPGNVINPPVLAERAEALAKEAGLECEIWDEKRLEQERMGALLAVGRGSATPPRLIRLSYVPGKAKKKIVFVGKGLTFDSGGLDIKPADFMTTMKGDKSGGCNVLGIMKGVAALAPEVEVHGLIAAAENMPSGTAYRPDDIVRARNGRTVEINNTDAEGRLALADALCLASEMKPDAIIDMATLTGACVVALGKWMAGLFSRDDALAEALLASAKRRGERFWRLPAEDEKIEEGTKSPFADLINSGGRYGGATFATIFLSNFVDKDIPWAHLDIAGVDFMDKEWGVCAKGATGIGVRTCLDYLTNL